MLHTFIALLRGINVGGHHKLPMRELAELLESLGLTNVRTYIQSGNVVFQSEQTDQLALSEAISIAIDQNHGFRPHVFILDHPSFQAAMAANPFPEGEAQPKSLHFFFLEDAPKDPDLAALETMKAENERFALIDKVFYLHAPDGIGRSKVAEKFGRGWDVAITARNWRTVSKINALAEEIIAAG